MSRLSKILSIMLLALLAVACSTTRRISVDDPLYTGVKRIHINVAEGEKVPEGLDEQVKEVVNVAPNNSLISPYVRHPFPIGLWVYNNWEKPSSGFKHWLYEMLVEEPVLLSDVRPEVRVHMIDELLQNNGYFSGGVSYELLSGKNPKKVKVRYTINAGKAYLLDSISLLPDTCHLNHLIDSVAMRGSYLVKGSRYSTDSLAAERVRITNAVRNHGYYFFRPEYIEYLADSTITRGAISLRMTLSKTIPQFAMASYVTGDVTVTLHRNQGGGEPDTTKTPQVTIIQMQPSKLRTQLIPECVTFRKGRTFSVRNMTTTQNYLSRMGIFNAINVDVMPDSTASRPTLDVNINCTFDTPLEASIEVNATSKSNSYLGPGLTIGVTNRNMFGGGEQFNVSLTGAYEWQTGRDRGNSVFNSYEFGISTSLSFPRMLLPGFVTRRRRTLNWTRISLNADILNRPHYFKMAQFNASLSYDWRANRYTTHSLTPIKLTYTKLINTTADFDSIMAANPAVAQSFESQFVPQISYTYTYDRKFGRDNTLNLQLTAQEAGNILWSVWELTGSKEEKQLFGTPFSQFVKGTAQIVYGHRLGGTHWLMSRVAVGVAHAYGNSTQVPYSEQFYVGGANSVRAFTVRSIGPGSYHTPNDNPDGYFDQTGTFKFEANLEYRFPIYGMFRGALFLDAGNVWLLKDDPQRPGGTLRGATFFKDLALGTGVGLRFDMEMLVVRADLGYALHAPYNTGHSGYFNMPSFKKSLAFHLAIGYPF
ncbi:MAG: BamA/TamA family outer membrane protein [Muribaculaceae bacterium]|nr:BamA/TamA family outer membrane protein [Muribaculaceae bacterium]